MGKNEIESDPYSSTFLLLSIILIVPISGSVIGFGIRDHLLSHGGIFSGILFVLQVCFAGSCLWFLMDKNTTFIIDGLKKINFRSPLWYFYIVFATTGISICYANFFNFTYISPDWENFFAAFVSTIMMFIILTIGIIFHTIEIKFTEKLS